MCHSKIFVPIAMALALTACAGAALHRDGMREFEAGDYEAGIVKLQDAVTHEPGNATFRLDLLSRRSEAVQRLIAQGDAARASGRLDEAQRGYERVLGIEPGNARAQRGLETLARDRRHQEAIAQATREVEQGKLAEAESRLRRVLAEDPGSAAAASLRQRIEASRGPQSVTPQLRARDNRPVSLEFRDASTKMVFEVLARQTGINFIFDRDVKNDGRTTIFVRDVGVDQAIELILGQNQLGRQVLSENMVLVYPNTATKQKEYQDQIVRTFFLTNGDPKKAMEMLKSLLAAKTLYVDERTSAIVMRDTPEMIRMAERLIAATDVPEAEVMMEVEVLELTRSRLEQLGIRYPDGVKLSPTALAGDPLVLKDLANQDSTTIKVSDVSVGLDLKKSVGTTNVLASPRIRARSREKAKILIGQRVPVITTSTILTNGGGNGTSSNVQYVDVGLTLDVEPVVHLDSDVAIKVNLEVSSILNTVKIGDSLAYQIGTRNATTLLRLKDGETQILAGLISDQDRRVSDHLPGLGDMPLLGRLFGTRKVDGEKSEIVLSITPRIIRSQPRAASENTEFWFGTESTLRSAPLGASTLAPMPSTPSSTGAAAAPANVAPAAEEGGAATPPGAAEEPAVARARPELTWQGPAQVSVGQTFDVALQLATKVDLADVRSMVRFDSAVFELLGADAGDVVPADAREALRPVINQRSGRAQFDVPGGNLSGSGALLVLHFKALSPRPATMIAVQSFAAKGTDGGPVPTMAPRPLTVVVQQ